MFRINLNLVYTYR